MRKHIVIFGGDGFCGWPTSLGFSNAGYDVTVVDNLSRRKIDIDLGCRSLTPITTIAGRITSWEELTGKNIRFVNIDLANQYSEILSLIREIRPNTIIHFAEQRSAPYSMTNSNNKRYTVSNNINATHNLLCAIVESGVDAHLLHLGSMGVYGYGTAGMPVPEGYLKATVKGIDGPQEIEVLHPANPGSIYHMTKTQDALMFYYYNKNDGLRITDLHQGIVWGTNTEETMLDEALINRFDYDGDYGTVLNRFLMQSVIGHPITVYGSGGQTRAFIHIRDTVKCILLAAQNPPEKGQRVQILNQTTETHTVNELAKTISKITGAEVRYYKNPRQEDSKNQLQVENGKFLKMGLKPTTLSKGLMQEVMDIVERYKERCDLDQIICKSVWSKNIVVDKIGSLERRNS